MKTQIIRSFEIECLQSKFDDRTSRVFLRLLRCHFLPVLPAYTSCGFWRGTAETEREGFNSTSETSFPGDMKDSVVKAFPRNDDSRPSFSWILNKFLRRSRRENSCSEGTVDSNRRVKTWWDSLEYSLVYTWGVTNHRILCKAFEVSPAVITWTI